MCGVGGELRSRPSVHEPDPMRRKNLLGAIRVEPLINIWPCTLSATKVWVSHLF